jgi:hypothetical protein
VQISASISVQIGAAQCVFGEGSVVTIVDAGRFR